MQYQKDPNKDYNIKYLLSELDEKVEVSGLCKLSQKHDLEKFNIDANTVMVSALLVEIEKLEADRLGQVFEYIENVWPLQNKITDKISYTRDLNKDYNLTIILSELDGSQEARSRIYFSEIKRLSELHEFDIINTLISVLIVELDIAEAKKLGQEYYPNKLLKEDE